MLYSARIKKAALLSFDAHKDQVDKGGYPYFMHPLHLAEKMETESTAIIALLHDVLEDCPGFSIERIKEGVGLSEEEADALILLTHKDDVDYETYVRSLLPNPLARTVKKADMEHNLIASRLDGKPHPKKELLEKCYGLLLEYEKKHE